MTCFENIPDADKHIRPKHAEFENLKRTYKDWLYSAIYNKFAILPDVPFEMAFPLTNPYSREVIDQEFPKIEKELGEKGWFLRMCYSNGSFGTEYCKLEFSFVPFSSPLHKRFANFLKSIFGAKENKS